MSSNLPVDFNEAQDQLNCFWSETEEQNEQSEVWEDRKAVRRSGNDRRLPTTQELTDLHKSHKREIEDHDRRIEDRRKFVPVGNGTR